MPLDERGFCEALHELVVRAVRESLADLQRSFFLLATGRMKQSPFSESALDGFRTSWFGMLPDPVLAGVKTPFQPPACFGYVTEADG